MLSLQTHTACRTERASTRSPLSEALLHSNPSGLPTSGPWINCRRANAVGRCCKRGAFSHLRQGHVEKWGRTRDTHQKTGVNRKEMDKKGRRERTGRKRWERTEDKWRQGHKAGVTRKGNAKSKSQAETSLETNLFNRVCYRGCSGHVTQWGERWTVTHPGQRGEGRGQWWSTCRLGMVGNVNALPKYDFSLSRWQSSVTKSWHKYQPWIPSRFKFSQVQIYPLKKKQQRNYLNLVILLFVPIIFRTDATVAAVLFKWWHFHF